MALVAAIKVTGPIFLWVLLGAIARRLGWLGPVLAERLSLWVFRYGMPIILGLGASRVDYSQVTGSTYLQAGIFSVLVITLLGHCYGRWRRFPQADHGVFLQAVFRSNLGIIGIALCASAYGERGLVMAALPVAVLTVVYNVLAVYVLNRAHGRSASPLGVLLGIARNPLVVGIAVGMLVSIAGWTLPGWAYQVGNAYALLVLPLAVLVIGAALSLKSLRESGRATLDASVWRLVVAPLITVLIALAWGVRGEELGVLFLLLAGPVATASFVMVVAVGGNGALAANIVLVTTLLSLPSITLGMAVLQAAGLL
ncbi:AEC family transporter [Halieaceae bacterium IMCC14734]|uniref:AEC family transporter n=2 Tax=Candidatus Litorirhabdus singularis TaxID=2518993 RepID=A0ABT3TJK8_9GAMM|nr:AEC family transporter [Candidatus Litorirhabdus singularis]